MTTNKTKIIFANNKINNQSNSLQQMQIWAHRNQLKKLTLKSKFDNNINKNVQKIHKKNEVCLKISVSYKAHKNENKNVLNQNQYLSPIKQIVENKSFNKLSVQRQKKSFPVDRNFFVTNIKTHLNLYHHKQSSSNNFISINKINLKQKNKNNKTYLQLKNQQKIFIQSKSQRIHPSKREIILSSKSKHKRSISSVVQQQKKQKQNVKDFFCVSPKNIYYSQQIQKNINDGKQQKLYYKRSLRSSLMNYPFSAKPRHKYSLEQQQSQNQSLTKRYTNYHQNQTKKLQIYRNNSANYVNRPKSCNLSNQKINTQQLKKKQVIFNQFNKGDQDYINSGWKIQNNQNLDENQEFFNKL